MREWENCKCLCHGLQGVFHMFPCCDRTSVLKERLLTFEEFVKLTNKEEK